MGFTPLWLARSTLLRRKLRALAELLIALAFVALTRSTASAQRVIVVPPTTETLAMSDAFNRLKAELTLHHFDVLVARAQLTPNPAAMLTRLAHENGALAAIAIVYAQEAASVQIWIVDRVSGKTTMREIRVEQNEDSAGLLAIRAVDLLRASVREFESGDKPPSDVIGVQRGPIPKVVQALARSAAPSYTLFIEALAVHERPRIGFGFGPLLGVSYRPNEMLSVGLVFAGPVFGAHFSSTIGTSELRQEFTWGELMLGSQCTTNLRAEVGLLLGALFLQARGQPQPPWIGLADHTWTSLEGLQGNLQWQLLQRLAVQFSLRAMGTLPQLGVALGDDRSIIQLPIVSGSLGVRVPL